MYGFSLHHAQTPNHLPTLTGPSPDPGQSAPYQLDQLNPKLFTAYLSETGADIRFSL
jgi:hypothetical protein